MSRSRQVAEWGLDVERKTHKVHGRDAEYMRNEEFVCFQQGTGLLDGWEG